MAREDFHEAERLLAETGRDGKRWPPEKLKRTMIPVPWPSVCWAG